MVPMRLREVVNVLSPELGHTTLQLQGTRYMRSTDPTCRHTILDLVASTTTYNILHGLHLGRDVGPSEPCSGALEPQGSR